jgi:hypothetical protein
MLNDSILRAYALSNLDCLISRRLPAEQRDYAGSLRKERLEAVAQTKLDLTRGRPLAGDPPEVSVVHCAYRI